MNAYRKTAIVVGVLFIIGTVAGILSVVLTGSILGSANYLVEVHANASQITAGAMFILIMGIALALVPVVMYPVFKKYSEVLALGYVVFRGAIETVIYVFMVLIWLFLILLCEEYVAAGAPDASYFQTLGAILLKWSDVTSSILTIFFSVGALMLYYLFYTSRLIPRWLSVWGFIAILLNLATGILVVFHLMSPFSTINTVMNFPIFLQEMVMAVWLIAKGFNPSEIAYVDADSGHQTLHPSTSS